MRIPMSGEGMEKPYFAPSAAASMVASTILSRFSSPRIACATPHAIAVAAALQTRVLCVARSVRATSRASSCRVLPRRPWMMPSGAMRMDDPLVLPHLPETVMSPPAAMFFSARSVLGPSGLAYLSFTRSAHAIISFTTLIGTTCLSRM